MAKPKVKRQDRLRVYLTISFPDINKNKSYRTSKRKFEVYVDDVLNHKRDHSSEPQETIAVRLRSLITIKKTYDGRKPDSIFTYRVGENFATLQDNSYGQDRKKIVEVNFNERNFLEVLTDTEFNEVQAISE